MKEKIFDCILICVIIIVFLLCRDNTPQITYYTDKETGQQYIIAQDNGSISITSRLNKFGGEYDAETEDKTEQLK